MSRPNSFFNRHSETFLSVGLTFVVGLVGPAVIGLIGLGVIKSDLAHEATDRAQNKAETKQEMRLLSESSSRVEKIALVSEREISAIKADIEEQKEDSKELHDTVHRIDKRVEGIAAQMPRDVRTAGMPLSP